MKLKVTTKTRIWELLLVMFGIAGTLVVQSVTLSRDRSRWVEDRDYQDQRALLEKRIELIAKTQTVLVHVPRRALVYVAHRNRYLPKDIPLEIIEKLTQLDADLKEVLTLDTLYFGPKTQAAVRPIATFVHERAKRDQAWWEIDPKLTEALLHAMSEEMTLGTNFTVPLPLGHTMTAFR